MKTEILTVKNPQENMAAIEKAAAVLKAGGLVVFPTETVYGIGGLATSPDAAHAIYEAKGRPSDNPLIVHIEKPSDAERYAVTSDTYYRLAKAFMPGPLTVILPKKDTVPDAVTGGLATVALRVPAHPVAAALISAVGTGIAAPSANLSGRPSPTTATHVVDDLSGRVDVIIDGGACEVGLESTIIALDGDVATLLRPGAITVDALALVCGEVKIAPAVTKLLGRDEKPLSPGMKYRHYAPRATLTLLDGEDLAVTAYLKSLTGDKSVGILCYDEEIPLLTGAATLFPIGGKEDLEAQAKRLFAALREADGHPACKRLYAHLPPREGLGLALYNRLIRAAAHTIEKV